MLVLPHPASFVLLVLVLFLFLFSLFVYWTSIGNNRQQTTRGGKEKEKNREGN